MISVGIAQIKNSTDHEKNFLSIMTFLERFQKQAVDLVLFPECGLSGFSAKMKECTSEVLQNYLQALQMWSDKTGIAIVLPTAVCEQNKIFNSGFYFYSGSKLPFYKLGLTESEKKFFSLPDAVTQKNFAIKDFHFAVLICMEAQQEPWTYFKNDEVDFILWPAYWGSTLEENWKASADHPVINNSRIWQRPLLQANFAFNDISVNSKTGPEGLSFIIDSDNSLKFQGAHREEDALIVQLEKSNGKTLIRDCLRI